MTERRVDEEPRVSRERRKQLRRIAELLSDPDRTYDVEESEVIALAQGFLIDLAAAEQRKRALEEAVRRALALRSSVDGHELIQNRQARQILAGALQPPEPRPPAERIADVLHSIGFGAERHGIAKRMLEYAQSFPEVPVQEGERA